ncbi:MAG: TIGR03960 family B12-binding radical SAM protein [Phycisphaerae bacterium]|nr:TIGR03960 family B12-binding radical SAM protein [Phycisphaerae bacterium]
MEKTYPDISRRISEEVLPRVQGPGQYVGLETNARRKDVHSAEVTVALAFPDAYTIGVSHVGGAVLYHAMNDLPFVACDRTYCPQPDAEEVMRTRGVSLFGWESRTPLRDFDVLGFSLAYELCVTNVLTMLDLAGIPPLARERTEQDPLIVGGDALADSPEPLADFFDVFFPGDGEEPLRALVELLRRRKNEYLAQALSREALLLEIARTVPSAYVPRFYRFEENHVVPARTDVPATIHRACVADLGDSPVPHAPLVPLFEGVHERVVIEIMRGCPNLCRFCQAGHVRLPVRRRGVEEILAAARVGIAATGFREISLLSLSASDYPNLDELIEKLNAEFAGQHVSISLPSLRADAQLRLLPKLTGAVRPTGLTLAAEAGSQRLRDAIRKGITEADMLAGVQAAWRAGLRSVKVYFIAGLPGETPEDIDAIFDLCLRLSDTRRDVDGRRGAVTAAVSWFVPKPHTPMQWSAIRRAEYFWSVRERLRELSARSPITFKFHRIEQSLLEGLLSRGGREVGEVILTAWRNGARMDSWTEHWRWETWQSALAETGLDFDAVVHEELPLDAPLPWSHIRPHLDEAYLRREYKAMTALRNDESADA